MYDGSAIAMAELRFREDLWRTAPSDAVEEAGVEYARFGPLLATVFGLLPEISVLNVVQGAAEPTAVDDGHLAQAVEWLRKWEVDYRVSVAGDRPGTKRAEEWLAARGYEPGATVRRYVHTLPGSCEPTRGLVQIRKLKAIDDEHLGPVPLGDLVAPSGARCTGSGTRFLSRGSSPGRRRNRRRTRPRSRDRGDRRGRLDIEAAAAELERVAPGTAGKVEDPLATLRLEDLHDPVDFGTGPVGPGHLGAGGVERVGVPVLRNLI
jgi:hypothetical protein